MNNPDNESQTLRHKVDELVKNKSEDAILELIEELVSKEQAFHKFF